MDPKQLFNLPGVRKLDAGNLMVVVAGGPSIQVLKKALALARAQD